VIGQQLQRHHVQDGAQGTVVLGHADDVHAGLAADVRVVVGKHVELAAAGAHFLHVALELFQQCVVGRHRHHRHLVGHQGQRAVLEFTGRVGLGVDVADLLELERTFQRNGVVQAAAQEEGVLLARKVFAPGDDLRLQRQHGLQRHGQVAQGLEFFGLLRVAQAPAHLRQRQRQQVQAGQLGGEGLGAGHADFHAGARDVGQFALAHHRAGGHVADGQRVRHAQAACMLQGGQRVGRLAALRDGDDQRARVGHAVAVAVFAGDLHAGGDAGDALQPVLGRHAAVQAGAAGQDQHAVDGLEDAVCAVAEQLGADAGHAFQRVGQRTGLLEDFLLHVVAVGAQLGRAAVGVHGAHDPLHRVVAAAGVGAADPGLAQLQVYHVAFFQVDDLVGHAGQRHRVAGQEVLARGGAAHAQHQGRALACAHHALGFVAAEHGNGVGAAQAGQGALHGVQQVAVVQAVHEVRDDFGVGLAVEDVAALPQFRPQFVVVFDDAVVHQGDARCVGAAHRHALARREVRVRVVHRRRAVRGPACVGDAGARSNAVRRHVGFQLRNARRAARAAQFAALVHGHAAAVVATVFQALEALQQDGNDVALADRADDATHG
jgi:hypothetical protein